MSILAEEPRGKWTLCLEIAKHIHDLAANAGMKQLYLIGNRIMSGTQKEAVISFAEKNGLSLLTFIPFDEKVTDADMLGETPLNNKEITAMQAIDNICDVLLRKDV